MAKKTSIREWMARNCGMTAYTYVPAGEKPAATSPPRQGEVEDRCDCKPYEKDTWVEIPDMQGVESDLVGREHRCAAGTLPGVVLDLSDVDWLDASAVLPLPRCIKCKRLRGDKQGEHEQSA